MGNWRRWQEDDGEEVLWVCPLCDAHVHADSVGNQCPECGEPIEEDADET